MGLRDFLVQGVGRLIPDKMYIQIKFFQHFRKFADLKNPKRYTEKLQWLKLYDRKPIYTTMVDKYASKKYVADLIGEEYVIPCVGGPWESADDIDFDALPDQFVLKTNHDCGGVVICKDKSTFDFDGARAFLSRHLKNDYYLTGREWPYKNIKRCIFAEEYLEEAGIEAVDYKTMCFDGEPKLIHIHLGRFTNHTQDYYDINWEKQEMEDDYLPKSDIVVEKPIWLEKMLLLSSKLSSGIPHIRCDWYCVNGKLYVGELTFFDASGFAKFTPDRWDYTLGSWIKLDCVKKEDKK